MPLTIDVYAILGANLLPKTHQNPPKIDASGHSSWASIFDWFLIAFLSMFHSFFFQLQHAQPCRLWFLLRENVGSLETPFSMLSLYWTPIWYQLGSILPSKYLPKIMKNHENIDRKRLPIMQPFSLRFGTPKTSLLGPNLNHLGSPDGPRDPPDPPQEHPKSLQDAPKRQKHDANRAPKRCQDHHRIENIEFSKLVVCFS